MVDDAASSDIVETVKEMATDAVENVDMEDVKEKAVDLMQ